MLVEAFAETQLPRGAVSLLLGGAEDVLALAADDRVRVVSFTGGRKAGAAIATAAAGKRLILELGGVCCAYVAADADLNRAADALASGMTWAAGQNCLHTQRVFAHVDIYQELASKLVSRLENWGVTGEGCGSPIAPLSDHARRETATASMHSAIASGATLLSGGSFSGRRMAPVLLAGVPENHPLCREEVFAPLATIDKVGSYEEAASRINACGPAINAALFTNQMDLILRAQDELQAGAIIVNDSTDFRIDAMPFGGDGAAGLGREGVRSTIAEMCSPRLLCLRS
jgi:glyceraldehyde-3-phosphate dehydrogenase (NADP+)